MKFIKLQYKSIIKKVLLTEQELTWDHLCVLIMQSFSLKDQKRIQLKYIDFEKEEVTVSNNSELAHALNLYFVQKFIKFFVLYSGVIEQQSVDSSKDTMASQKECGEKATTITEASVSNSPVLILSLPEIQELFSSAFEKAKIFSFLQKGLLDLMQKKGMDIRDSAKFGVEFAVHTDYFEMAEYFKALLASSLHQPADEGIESPPKLPSIQITRLVSIQEEPNNPPLSPIKEQKPEEESKGSPQKPPKNLDCDSSSIVESVYEVVENKDSENSEILADPAITYSPFLKKSISEPNQNKGRFKVSIRENKGKATFQAFEQEIEEKECLLKKSISEISFDFLSFHQTVKPDKPDFSELIANPETYEFKEKILKRNDHNLDKDLPAPYLFEK